MSFAVSRMIKMKANDLKGMQYHNQRERESKTNADIEKSKTNLNYDLVNSEKISFPSKVNEIIEEQKTGSRKIRKDAVVVCEWVITSDSAYFKELSAKEEQRFFEESYKFFSERYGKQNVPYAIVHKDEKTPHMHLGVVPMRDGKLQAKNIFNRAELIKIQNDFPEYLQERGFDLERGKQGSTAKHIETQKFKADTLDRKVQELEKSLNEVAASIYTQQETFEKVDTIPVKERKDMKAMMGLKGSNRVEMTLEDFESIKTLAKSSEALRNENKRLKNENENTLLENEKLKKDLKRIRSQNSEMDLEMRGLRGEIEKLKDKIHSLTNAREYLAKTIDEIKKNAPDFIGVGLEKIQDYVGEIRLHSLANKFGKDVFKEDALKALVPEDERNGADRYIQKVKRFEIKENEKKKEKEKIKKPVRKQEKDFEMDR